MNKSNFMDMSKFSVAPVSVKANSRSDVKRSGRSQNRRLQTGLPA